MISFNQFVKCMRKEMGKKFQGRLAIKVEKVEKNNGVVITSLSGKREDNKEWLSVGLDSYCTKLLTQWLAYSIPLCYTISNVD